MGAGLYTLLSAPKDIQIFFPMAALLGHCWGWACWPSAVNWW